MARRRRRTRFLALLLLAALGAAGIAGGGWLAYRDLTRAATPAEIAAAGQAELASRWERLTAGQLFPPHVGYTGLAGVPASATLVGIAPRASCRAALSQAAATALGRPGCTEEPIVVLWATTTTQRGPTRLPNASNMAAAQQAE